ncbi:hypothetical protein PENTCL1PPCAC_19780, partial [Pristionchus entomophagus]
MNGESTSSGPPPLLVSIAEIVEVRAQILSSAELLSLAALSSSVLPPCTRGKAFGPSQVFLSAEGNVHTGDAAAAAVFCMGAVLRWSGGAETKDADLFSLVNVLTVAMVGTRPTANRMGQMAKNQLKTMEDDDVSYSSSDGDLPVLQPGTSSAMKQAVEYVSDDDVIMETSEEEEEEREEQERMRVIRDANMNEKRHHEAAAAAAALLITHHHHHEEERREERQPSPIPSRAEVLDRLKFSKEEKEEERKTALASFPPPPVSILPRGSFDDEDIVHAAHEEDSFALPSFRPFKDDLAEELKRQELEEERQRLKKETPIITRHASPPHSSPSSRASSTLSPPS